MIDAYVCISFMSTVSFYVEQPLNLSMGYEETLHSTLFGAKFQGFLWDFSCNGNFFKLNHVMSFSSHLNGKAIY